MTKKRAERLIDSDIHLEVVGKRFVSRCDISEGRYESVARTEKESLSGLINQVLQKRFEDRAEYVGWRCERCGSIIPLQKHHRVFRSMGGKHTTLNIEALCMRCHEKIHT